MSFDTEDTIAALGSATGGSARGIVRISGPDVQSKIASIFVPRDPEKWNNAKRPEIHSGIISLKELSCDLAVDISLWPTARSFTGQPMAEIHTIGSPPLLEALLQELFKTGIRPALQGEFTLRAFLSGRIDLMQAEGVLGVIDSRDDEELNAALSQLAGGLSSQLNHLREQLLVDRADLEAGLDFVEEDIDFVHRDEFIKRLGDAIEFVGQLLEQTANRMTANITKKVVLAGLPNAGKSSLFNKLIDDHRAIVSNIEGTTRDYLTAQVSWKNLNIQLVDTAGWESVLDENSSVPMSSAQSFRDQQTEQADLLIWCRASDLSNDQQRIDDQLQLTLPQSTSLLFINTKADLSEETNKKNLQISVINDQGIELLKSKIVELLSDEQQEKGLLLGSTSARCHNALSQTRTSLAAAKELATSQAGDEIISLELATAIDHLGEITGAVYTDDLLDRIFSRFCIGK